MSEDVERAAILAYALDECLGDAPGHIRAMALSMVFADLLTSYTDDGRDAERLAFVAQDLAQSVAAIRSAMASRAN